MTHTPGLFLAIDQSTSATKAMLFTSDGGLLDQESLSHRQIYPRAGWVEHDADEIFNNAIKVASSLLNRHVDKWNRLQALSITNQRETFVVFDRETGQPLHNAIVWQCRRGGDICKDLVDAGHEEVVHNLTGLKIDTYFPASKLIWLLDDRPELRARLKDGTALFGTIETYLIYRLTGGKVYATDHTNASRTLFYDIGKLTWSQDLCEIFELDFGILPDVRESAAWYGDTDLEGFLNRRISICGVMGDSQAALFAQRCFAPGSAKVTFGTGSSILLNIGHEKRLSERGTVTALAWVLKGEPTYAYEGIINFTGAIIAWLRDELELIQKAADTEDMARAVKDNGGVYLVPAFVGLSAPYWAPHSRAIITGLTPSSNKNTIVRAALEAIGYRVNDVLGLMTDEAGMDLEQVHADGGASRNTFLMEFVAGITQKKVKVSSLPELSALGAVFSGLLGMKVYGSLEELAEIPSESVIYQPEILEEERERLLIGWKQAVQQVLYKPTQG